MGAEANLISIRDDPSSELSIPLLELTRRLDVEHRFEEAWTPVNMTASGLAVPMVNHVVEYNSSRPPRRPRSLIEEKLDRAILAFTARWSPLDLRSNDPDEMVTTSWRRSRSDMITLLNQVSYRSVLALYLFAQTPVPADICEGEEFAGITGPVCMHTALMHIQKLRQRCDPGKPS